MRSRLLRITARAPVQLLLGMIGLLWLVPTIGLFVTSLMPAESISELGWWHVFAKPQLATLENYRALFEDSGMTRALLTTLQIAVGNTLILVVVAAFGAYALACLAFRGRDAMFIGVIGLLVVPLQVALIPVFSLYNTTGLFDTVLGMILFHVAFGLPFAIFLLRNFFSGIPRDVLESARMDGASELRIFLRIVLPLAMPAIASLAIFQFLWTWNDLIVALTFGREVQPITVAIFSQMRQFGTNIEIIAPAAFVSLAIPLCVFFAFQRHFVRGLLAGAVK